MGRVASVDRILDFSDNGYVGIAFGWEYIAGVGMILVSFGFVKMMLSPL